jgi:predicted DNA-binding transcriptional regulator AlpA
MEERLTYDIKTASRLLGISLSLGYELARRGEFPGCIRLGARRFVVSKAILHSYLDGRTQAIYKDDHEINCD